MYDLKARVELLRLYLVSAILGVTIGASVSACYLLYELFFRVVRYILNVNLLLIVLIPPAGLLLSQAIVLFLAESKETGCGTHAVLEAFHFKGGFVKLKDALIKPLASVVTISFYGSAGLEGPSLLLGSGIASTISRKLKVDPTEYRDFFLAGAAAGLSAIFRAPLTGILFALEIPYKRDIEREVFIEASIASIVAYIVTVSILGTEPLFAILTGSPIPSIELLAHSIVLGLLSTVVALVFIDVHFYLELVKERLEERLKPNIFYYPILAGLLLGLFGLFFMSVGFDTPVVLGLGYDFITEMMHGSFSLSPAYMGVAVLLLVLLLKMVSTSLTLEYGGSGGIFIPTIFIGATLGYAYAYAFNLSPKEMFIVTAMAALLAATHKTLLTSVAFVAETCGPVSIIPAILAATISYFLSGEKSLYPLQLPHKALREELALEDAYSMIDEYCPDFLDTVQAKDLLSVDVPKIPETTKIRDALKIVNTSRYTIYPVVDSEGRVVGYVRLDELLEYVKEYPDMSVELVKVHSPIEVRPDEPLRGIVEKMLQSGEGMVLVVDEEGKLVGAVCEDDVLRRMLPACLRHLRKAKR